MIKHIRDIIALVLLIGIIPGLWVATALVPLKIPEAVHGALIMGWGLVLNFYFRKRPSGEGS